MGKRHLRARKELPHLRPVAQALYDPWFEHDACGVGFVADIKGRASHQILRDARSVNSSMDHRGGLGFEENTGDGAGILSALPHRLFQEVTADLGFALPSPGGYAAGNIFLPRDPDERRHCQEQIRRVIEEEGQLLLGWRNLPVDPDGADVGPAARAAMPKIMQLFVGGQGISGDELERRLYVIRKRFTRLLRGQQGLEERLLMYACSLSSRVIVYKGMLTPGQLFPFYQDLMDPRFESHLAMVHSRFSTNTFPSWDRAQPNRLMSHNGEINTLRGNINWMTAREGVASSERFGSDISKLFPVIEPDCSDSGTFDNVLELLLMAGRTLPEAVMMMIPEAWQQDSNMSAEKKAFYEFNSSLMEPWDGPASVAFTDGKYIGAVLDRNGLRPSRYYLTHDDKVIMASEVGVLDVPPEKIKVKGRLQPGKMFLVDFVQGRMIPDEELKARFASRRPYRDWLERQRLCLEALPAPAVVPGLEPDTLVQRMRAFGYTVETMQFMILPLVTEERDPVGSMGNDAALACLSDRPRMIHDYFKQLFAQVTNPAIDSIREEVVMSLECMIGPEANLLATTQEHAHRLRIPHPILSNEELGKLREMNSRGWRSCSIDITFPGREGTDGFMQALDRICHEASGAIRQGYSLIILSDRAVSREQVPISSLVACGAVHHHLVARHERTRVGLVVETGEAREVHHHCLLIGYGADAINPYLAFESLWQARIDGLLESTGLTTDEEIVAGYCKGVAKGILKVMAKMGISTLQSYKGAQIFEAVGLGRDVIDRCFVGTVSRVQGIGFAVLQQEMVCRHELGYPVRGDDQPGSLPNPGDFHWRRNGERHMWDPVLVANLQTASRGKDADAYWRFARHANEETSRACTLRGLLRFRKAACKPVPLDQVEPARSIVRRFATGAMSFGSISAESHETLAIAMNRLGGKSNTGEGGEDPARFRRLLNGDSKRSAIKQVASGRFGVTIWYLANADELQIKIVQGAKPGEGGELPGGKVDSTIARIRHSTPGVGLISPPPHHDIYSIEDMAQLIHDLKNANPDARISVKLGSEIGVGTVAAGVVKAKADHLVIAGHDGGTGASPLTSIKHAGLPWELGLAETHQTLVMNNLRSRVVLQTDGQLKTGRDLAIAALLGAEEFGFATAPLVALGCIMMRKCHLNTCPVGIATQDPELRKKFSGQPQQVVNYMFMVAEELRQIMAELGFRKLTDMVGRVDLLEMDRAVEHWKASGIDLSALLKPARIIHQDTDVFCTTPQNHGLDKALDRQLIELAKPAIEKREPVYLELPVRNTNRVVGTTLSHTVARRWGAEQLPPGTIHVKLNGSAGQSLGAWLARGITLEVEGDANDYVGKGLSGGRLIVYPSRESTFKPEENVLIGNVVLYGATSGDAYFRGVAAERFCVRNSGASAVVEGVGDHGCEYMTGGRVVVLGPTGRNFGAGMSGGIAYVYDPEEVFASRCNLGTVELEEVRMLADVEELHELVTSHRKLTGSTLAGRLLCAWDASVPLFRKVMPKDYKRVLVQQAREREMAAG